MEPTNIAVAEKDVQYALMFESLAKEDLRQRRDTYNDYNKAQFNDPLYKARDRAVVIEHFRRTGAARAAMMTAAKAAREASESVVRARSVLARLKAAEERRVEEEQEAIMADLVERRERWLREAEGVIFRAHVNASQVRRWSTSQWCRDSTADLHHQHNFVPSTYGRRHDVIMTYLDEKGYTARAFAEHGKKRDDFVREAVKRLPLPHADRIAIRRHLDANPEKAPTKEETFPWLYDN